MHPRLHGTYNGYNNYGCRCEECRAANAAAHRKYVARRRARQATVAPVPPKRRDPHERGRPYDVLRYIDYCIDPERPLIVDLASKRSIRLALREAEAALRAKKARVDYYRERVWAQLQIVEGLERLARLDD